MTQITVRKVDDELAEKIRQSAKAGGESVNSLLLKLLRRQFGSSGDGGVDEPVVRNDLEKYRTGWVEDPAFDAAMEDFSQVDPDDWK